MRTVEDESGDRYVLLKRSAESSLVRDPATGATKYVANDSLSAVDEATPLETAATGIDEPLRRLVTAVHDDRALGLVVTLVDRGATPVRTLLDATTLCESDLHGVLAEFAAAGLIEETRVSGERGYAPTEGAREAVAALRGED